MARTSKIHFLLLTNDDFPPHDLYDFAVPLLAAVLLPAGVLLIFVLVTVVVCVACKRSKKKEEEEDIEVEENPVYQIYELEENYERRYSINEAVDHNPDYA